ncbi:MAG: hypothetical protein ACLR0N_02865 [Bilophila wadsworthia]
MARGRASAFWRFDPAAYGWIGDDMAVLNRTSCPPSCGFELDIRHIGGSVAVQARASGGGDGLPARAGVVESVDSGGRGLDRSAGRRSGIPA